MTLIVPLLILWMLHRSHRAEVKRREDDFDEGQRLQDFDNELESMCLEAEYDRVAPIERERRQVEEKHRARMEKEKENVDAVLRARSISDGVVQSLHRITFVPVKFDETHIIRAGCGCAMCDAARDVKLGYHLEVACCIA
jgi:hypothetical protein